MGNVCGATGVGALHSDGTNTHGERQGNQRYADQQVQPATDRHPSQHHSLLTGRRHYRTLDSVSAVQHWVLRIPCRNPQATNQPCRCTGVGLTAENAASAAPVWGVIAEARSQRFTGKVSVGAAPRVAVWCRDGQVYLVERDDDAAVQTRLVTSGLVSPEDLAHGVMLVEGRVSLGRLFQRVPRLDRAQVVGALQRWNDATLDAIADLSADQSNRADIWTDLASGTLFGQRSVTDADSSTVIGITLNGDFIANSLTILLAPGAEVDIFVTGDMIFGRRSRDDA